MAIIIAATMGISLVVIALSFAAHNERAVMRGCIRLLMAGGLCFFLWCGFGWARVVSIVLFGLAGFIATVAGILFWGSEWASVSVTMFVLGATYLLCTVALMRNPDIKQFMSEQRSGNLI